MKKWLLLGITCCFTWFIEDVKSQKYIPYKTKKSWGFVERNKDSILLEGFERADFYKGGYAVVKQNDLYGALDSSLKISIPIKYDKIEYLSDNLIRATRGSKIELFSQNDVFNKPYQDFAFIGDHDSLIITANKNGKYGMINLDGKTIIPNIYEGPPKEELPGILVFPLREDIYKPKKKSEKIYYGALDLTGREIIPFNYLFLDRYGSDYIKATTMETKFYFTLKGEKVNISENHQFVKNEFFTEVFLENNQRAVYALNQDEPVIFAGTSYSDDYIIGPDTTGVFQILDKQGKLVKVKGAYQFQGTKYGLIKVCKIGENRRCSNYGLIDFNGKVVLPTIYANIHDWNSTYAVCSDTNANLRVGMIKISNNKKVLDFKHRIIKLMNCGYSIADEHPNITFYNSSVKVTDAIEAKDLVPGETYISIQQSFIEDIQKQYKYKTQSNIALLKECDKIKRKPIEANGLGMIKDKYGELPSSNLFAVNIRKDDYKFFFIDKNGLALTEAKYTGVSHREKDLILVFEKDSTGKRTYSGAVNLEGKQVISSSYDGIGEVYSDALIVGNHGVSGVISRAEEIIIPIRYNTVKLHESGYYLLRKFSQWIVADRKGKLLTKRYDEILELYPDGIFKVKLMDEEFYVDEKGNEYIER